MKHFGIISIISVLVLAFSGCSGFTQAEVYDSAVNPYRPVSEDNLQYGDCTIDLGDSVSVNGQGAWYKDNDILISRGGCYVISGNYDCGCIKVSTDDTVKLVFSNAEISNPDGCALVSDAQKLIIASDGKSTITGSGGDHDSAVYSNGALLFAGIGGICIDGGVYSRGGIRFGSNISTFCEILRTDDGDYIRGNLLIN